MLKKRSKRERNTFSLPILSFTNVYQLRDTSLMISLLSWVEKKMDANSRNGNWLKGYLVVSSKVEKCTYPICSFSRATTARHHKFFEWLKQQIYWLPVLKAKIKHVFHVSSSLASGHSLAIIDDPWLVEASSLPLPSSLQVSFLCICVCIQISPLWRAPVTLEEGLPYWPHLNLISV